MTKYFDARNLLHDWQDFHLDVSFCAEKGTMTSIVGPSGSGKSTILRLIAGLEDAISGTQIFLDGKEITHLAPSKRGIGLVSQSQSLFTHLSVEDNIGYGLRCRGFSKKQSREKASSYLARFNLIGFEKRAPPLFQAGKPKGSPLRAPSQSSQSWCFLTNRFPPLTRRSEKNSPLTFENGSGKSALRGLW